MSSPTEAAPLTQGSRRRRAPPFLGWLRDYDRASLPVDLVAGVTAAAVVIPKALAYATVAGLPVQAGLTQPFGESQTPFRRAAKNMLPPIRRVTLVGEAMKHQPRAR